MGSQADLWQITAVVLRRLREQAHLSQEDLAAKAGVSRSMIDKSERRERLPSLDVLFKIASGLNMKASEIIQQIEQETDKNFPKENS